MEIKIIYTAVGISISKGVNMAYLALFFTIFSFGGFLINAYVTQVSMGVLAAGALAITGLFYFMNR